MNFWKQLYIYKKKNCSYLSSRCNWGFPSFFFFLQFSVGLFSLRFLLNLQKRRNKKIKISSGLDHDKKIIKHIYIGTQNIKVICILRLYVLVSISSKSFCGMKSESKGQITSYIAIDGGCWGYWGRECNIASAASQKNWSSHTHTRKTKRTNSRSFRDYCDTDWEVFECRLPNVELETFLLSFQLERKEKRISKWNDNKNFNLHLCLLFAF